MGRHAGPAVEEEPQPEQEPEVRAETAALDLFAPSAPASAWELRHPNAQWTHPGKHEWGCMTQSEPEGALDRVYIYETQDEARQCVTDCRAAGNRALLVTRQLGDWDPILTGQITTIASPTTSSIPVAI